MLRNYDGLIFNNNELTRAKHAIDFIARRLHKRTAVARLP